MFGKPAHRPYAPATSVQGWSRARKPRQRVALAWCGMRSRSPTPATSAQSRSRACSKLQQRVSLPRPAAPARLPLGDETRHPTTKLPYDKTTLLESFTHPRCSLLVPGSQPPCATPGRYTAATANPKAHPSLPLPTSHSPRPSRRVARDMVATGYHGMDDDVEEDLPMKPPAAPRTSYGNPSLSR